jgi:hypothetical protein
MYHTAPDDNLSDFQLSQDEYRLMNNWGTLPMSTRNHLVKVRPDLWRIVARITSRNAIYEAYADHSEDE